MLEHLPYRDRRTTQTQHCKYTTKNLKVNCFNKKIS
jgi:hypothetical protein